MARVKLSEFDAKRLLFPHQPALPASTSTTSGQITKKFGQVPLVVKVDQGVKKRGKQGLVQVGVGSTLAVSHIRKWSDLGYTRFLVEPQVPHDQEDEKFLSLERIRGGWKVLYSPHGGVDIESNWDSTTTRFPPVFRAPCNELQKNMDLYHLSTLELNPFIIKGKKLIALDAAAELDDASLTLMEQSALNLTPIADLTRSAADQQIAALDASTPASLKFKLLNPKGKIWMLLSGGGASLVLADEVADLGLGSELANYGEYSGAPSADDVYSYTKIILAQLLRTASRQPIALVIAAGIANFTDVEKTFRGIIRALDEKKTALVQAQVKVFVRRGGPNEAKGLENMRTFLQSAGIPHMIHYHDIPLTRVIADVKEYLS